MFVYPWSGECSVNITLMASLSAHPGTQCLRHQAVPTANIQDLGLQVTGNILVNFVGNKLGNKKVTKSC